MIIKLILIRQLSRLSLNPFIRSFSRHSVCFDDRNDHSDVIGTFLSDIDSIKKSVKTEHNKQAYIALQESKEQIHNESQEYKETSYNKSQECKEPAYNELQESKESLEYKEPFYNDSQPIKELHELAYNELHYYKEPSSNDSQPIKDLQESQIMEDFKVYKNPSDIELQNVWGDLYTEQPLSETKKKLVSSKVYNESVMKNMYGKTILSSTKEKNNKKKSEKIKEQMSEYSSANSAEYWMANTISSGKTGEKKMKSSNIKTSKLSKKSTKTPNIKDKKKDDETSAKKKSILDAKVKKESVGDILILGGENLKPDSAVIDTKVEVMDVEGNAATVDNSSADRVGTADKFVTANTVIASEIVDTADTVKTAAIIETTAAVDTTAKPPIDNAAARQGKSILQIPFDRELRRTVPSVSKVLNISKSEESRLALERWEEKMILEMGVEGFKEYKETMFRRGHAIHSLIERYLLHGEGMHIDSIEDDVTRNHVQSISHLLHKIKDVQALESAVIHPKLNYCGIVDCVARLQDDSLCLIDWKTSEKAKPTVKSLFDNPLQVVAYLGAINADPNYHHLGRINQGAVVVIYNTGYSAVIHRFTTEQLRTYWYQWIHRIKLFQERSQDKNDPAMIAWFDRKK